MLHQLVKVTAVLALIVVILGAYTRLSDAGLGCPDWPGCYGELVVPADESAVANKQYLEQRALEGHKAWKEMIHRYAAGLLGLLILVIAIWSLGLRNRPAQPLKLPVFLLVLVIFQAVLGMWTVTLQLKPVVVMGHLLGGFTTLALLTLLYLRLRPVPANSVAANIRWRGWAILTLVVVIVQIALGGWTSSNYAALACPDFPYCQGSWWPESDFKEGFVLWRGLGINYEFGVLEHPARTAIHMAHRLGAIAAMLVAGLLSIGLIVRGGRGLARIGWLMMFLLIIQITLGISNVVFGLPLTVAVAHNAVAALLLLSLTLLNYQLWQRRY